MVKLELFATLECKHCCKVVEMVERVLKDFPHVNFILINLSEHPDALQQHGVLCSPTIVIDGKLEFLGAPKEGQLRRRLHSP